MKKCFQKYWLDHRREKLTRQGRSSEETGCKVPLLSAATGDTTRAQQHPAWSLDPKKIPSHSNLLAGPFWFLVLWALTPQSCSWWAWAQNDIAQEAAAKDQVVASQFCICPQETEFMGILLAFALECGWQWNYLGTTTPYAASSVGFTSAPAGDRRQIASVTLDPF